MLEPCCSRKAARGVKSWESEMQLRRKTATSSPAPSQSAGKNSRERDVNNAGLGYGASDACRA